MTNLFALPRRARGSWGCALVLGGLLTLWALEMGYTIGSGLADALLLVFCLGCSLLGWQAVLGPCRTDTPTMRGWVSLALLVIMFVCAEGLGVAMLVARVPWALVLAWSLSACFFMGAWMVAFTLFRRWVNRWRCWGWHLPLAVVLGGIGWWGFCSVEVWEINILALCLTAGFYTIYLLWDLAKRFDRRKTH